MLPSLTTWRTGLMAVTWRAWADHCHRLCDETITIGRAMRTDQLDQRFVLTICPVTVEPARPGFGEAAASAQARRDLVERLRHITIHRETARLLDLRADRSASPALAVVLRERAEKHRRKAEGIRANLAAVNHPSPPSKPISSRSNDIAEPPPSW